MTAEFENLVKTSLFSVHQEMGARLVPFAGWVLPLEYEGTVGEHEAVRSDAGVFDVSHLGTVWVTGSGALETVAATFTNDPSGLADGQAQYTLCCDDSGRIVDDLLVYRLDAERFLAVPNAANTRAVVAALDAAADPRGATVRDDSTRTSMLALQGPRSFAPIEDFFPGALDGLAYQRVVTLDLGPSDSGYLARTGYTGERGVELVLSGLDAPGYFRRLVEEYGVTPAGLGARDTLRLEMGYPLHGNDLAPAHDPYEAGLGWAVALDGRDFRGSDAVRRAAAADRRRRLRGLRATGGGGIPRAGMDVLGGRGEAVGTVTSGNYSPVLRTGIALAYLDAGVDEGDEVTVDVRGRAVSFLVVDPPFVDRNPRA